MSLTGQHRRGAGAAMARSFRARVLSLPLSAVSGLVMAALIIDAVGPSSYGYVALIATLFLLLPFADLGVLAVIVSGVAESKDPARDPHVTRLLISCLRVLMASGLAIGSVALILGASGTWAWLLGVPVDRFSDANIVITVAICTFAVGLPGNIGHAILLGLGRNEVAVWLSVISPASALAMCLLLKALAVAPLWYSIAQPAGLVLCAAVTVCVALRIGHFDPRRWFALVLARTSFPGLRIRNTAGPSFVLLLASPFLLQSDRFVIAHQGTAEQLAVYGLAAQLYAPLWTVAYTAGQPLWPQFARRRLEGEPVRGVWLRAMAVLTLLALLMGLGLTVLGPIVATVVSGGSLAVSFILFAVFAVLLLAETLYLPTWMCLTTPAGLRFQARWIVAAVVVKLALAWAITAELGAGGPVFASIAAIILCQLIPGLWAMQRRLAG